MFGAQGIVPRDRGAEEARGDRERGCRLGHGRAIGRDGTVVRTRVQKNFRARHEDQARKPATAFTKPLFPMGTNRLVRLRVSHQAGQTVSPSTGGVKSEGGWIQRDAEIPNLIYYIRLNHNRHNPAAYRASRTGHHSDNQT